MAVKMSIFDVRDCEKDIINCSDFQNFDLTLHEECLNEDTVKLLPKDELDNTVAISVFIDSDITEDVINSFKNLRIISTRSSSIDHINKNAALSKNIDIVNVENYSSKTAAQFTIGLMIALVRNLIPLSKFIELGETIDFTGYDISAMTLGIIGTGSTGACVCKMAQGFGMPILAYDIFEKRELAENTDAKYVDLETLLKESDIVTIHVPYTLENKNLITQRELDLMKDSAYLINTSKSKIVNIKDLYNTLKLGNLRGAALDIRTCSTINPRCLKLQSDLHNNLECLEEAEIVLKLAKMPNVILTPQIAYKTSDVMEYLLNKSIEGIRDCIKGGTKFRAC